MLVDLEQVCTESATGGPALSWRVGCTKAAYVGALGSQGALPWLHKRGCSHVSMFHGVCCSSCSFSMVLLLASKSVLACARLGS